MGPKVTLINTTTEALNMLILAKNTRLEMRPNLLEQIRQKTEDEKLKEVEYIANTIPSSWEFVDFIFLIEDVTRAFTHQFVRGRHASYAQQTMRVLNVSGWGYGTGPSIANAEKPLEGMSKYNLNDYYKDKMEEISKTYNFLIENGAAIEDARGILPTNILTNILVKMNLRTFAETVRKRSSSRVQGEYREVIEQMKQAAIAHLPWVQLFVDRTFDRAANELDKLLQTYIGDKERRIQMVKLLDQMRMQS